MTSRAVQMAMQVIHDRDGEVRASTVLAAARNKNNALHSQFEWDDTIAGEQYRLNQSRQLIRRVTIIHEGVAQPLVHVPVQVEYQDTPSREGRYLPVLMVSKSEDLYVRALAEATAKLSAAKRAVDELQRAAGEQDSEVLARLAIAVTSIGAAREALSIH